VNTDRTSNDYGTYSYEKVTKGNSGAGGTVNLGSSAAPMLGAVTTHGNDAMAIFAQSIGGGGGLATLGCSNAAATNSAHLASACWGNTQVAGQGGTPGEFVGGAGTNGVAISVNSGNAVSQNSATGAGSVNLYSNQAIITYGHRSMGVVAQSITGGGGFFSGPNRRIHSVTMPSQQRASNNSPGSININLSQSTITTHGDGAWGVFAQMVQGGGGFFGDSSQDLAFNVKYDQNSPAASDVFAGLATGFAAQRIANASSWNVNSCQSTGSCVVSSMTPGQLYLVPFTSGQVSWTAGDYVQLQTTQDPAYPYLLKQYDANGNLKSTVGEGRVLNLMQDYFFFEGNDNSTGAVFGARDITAASLTLTGIENPTSAQVDAYLAQYFKVGSLDQPNSASGLKSVVNQSLLGDMATANSGSNNPMTVTLTGSRIVTNGTNAHGMVLQNLGSVGGVWSSKGTKLNMGITLNGSNANGNTLGGKITLNMTGSTIYAQGQESMGVVIQSDGGGPGGSDSAIVVNLNNDSHIESNHNTTLMLVGGSYDATSPNQVNVNSGLIANDSNWNGAIAAADNTQATYNRWAIYAPTGYTDLFIGSAGAVRGNILLGIVTKGDMTNNGYWHGSTAIIANNSLHNYGVIYAGGEGPTGGLYIDGSLKHYADGEIHVDVHTAGNGPTHDVITVTGLARIEGEIVPQTQSLMPGSYSVLNAGELAHTGTVRDAHVFAWGATVAGNSLAMTPEANFTPGGFGLTGNQGSLAGYLQQHWDSASSQHATLFGYLHEHDQGDHAGYQNTLNQLSGQVLNSQAIQMKTVFATSLSDSLSCPTLTAQGLRLNQTDCAWAQITGSIAEQSADSANSGYHVTAGGIRLGAQRQIDARWTTGFALGYANNYMTSTGLTSNGQYLNASVSLNRKVDQWSFGGSLGVAYGWFKNNRTPQLGANGAAGSMADLYTSNSNMTMVGLRFRAAYEHEQKDHYIKPYVDLDVMYSHSPGYTESGSGALALKANSSSQYGVGITPMLEVGTDLVTDGKRRIKAIVSAGASFLPNNRVSSQMAFANGLSGAGTYDVITDGPAVLGRLNLGIHAFEANDLEVRVQYGLQAGDGYLSQSLSANLVWRF